MRRCARTCYELPRRYASMLNEHTVRMVQSHTGSLFAIKAGAPRSHIFLAIAVGLSFSAGLLLTAGSPLNQAGTLDPYVYAGYIHDYPGLLERFGRTYYSTRIAYIYPQRALTSLLGVEGGYYAFRFLALASAVAAVFTIGMRFYGYAPAILAAVWLSFTPWLPRSLLWTYVDGVAVVYLLIGVALLVVPTRKRVSYHVAAGAAFALAVNCNLLLLGYGGLFGPGWAFFYRRNGGIWLARGILALTVGFFAAYIALAFILYFEFPDYGFFFELVTIRTAIDQLGVTNWYKSLSSIIWEQHYYALLIPVTFLLAMLPLGARRWWNEPTPDKCIDFGLFVLSYLTSIVGLALILHFGFHSGGLSLPYYTIYFLPSCVLALIVLGGETQQQGGRIFGTASVYGGTGVILLSWLARPLLPHLEVASRFYLWLVVAVVTVGAALALRRIAAASVVLVTGATLLSLCLYAYRGPSLFIRLGYEIRKSSIGAAEWDIYHGGIFLQQFVNGNIRPNRSVGFWYSNKPDHLWLNSIQSVYLWGYSRVFPSARDYPGMPFVDEQLRTGIAGRRFLVLLGLSDAELNAGLAAIQAAGMPFREVERTHFQGQVWGYAATLIELKRPERSLGPLLFNIPLARLSPANGGSISPRADGLSLVTAPQQWSYSLMGRLRPEQESMQGAVVVRLRLQVEDGMIGVAVSSVGSNSSNLIREIEVDPSPETEQIEVDIPDVQNAEFLILRNRSPHGQSRVVLHSVDVLRPN
jgi:hypothetical protein